MAFVMASETEKAHALLQTFSTASVISSLGLGIFCFVADRLLQFSFIQQNDWLRAFSDNAVHGILGMWSWAIVIGLRKKSDFTEVTLAGFLASVIDVDHFFLAGSLSLKAALTLPRRPLLHCSTVIPVVALTLKFIMHLFRLKDSWCFLPWMLFISWTSHHVRDGIRHGLWICPFGKTPPLPYWLYVAITASLPHLCSFIMYLTGTGELMSIKHGIHIDVHGSLTPQPYIQATLADIGNFSRLCIRLTHLQGYIPKFAKSVSSSKELTDPLLTPTLISFTTIFTDEPKKLVAVSSSTGTVVKKLNQG